MTSCVILLLEGFSKVLFSCFVSFPISYLGSCPVSRLTCSDLASVGFAASLSVIQGAHPHLIDALSTSLRLFILSRPASSQIVALQTKSQSRLISRSKQISIHYATNIAAATPRMLPSFLSLSPPIVTTNSSASARHCQCTDRQVQRGYLDLTPRTLIAHRTDA